MIKLIYQKHWRLIALIPLAFLVYHCAIRKPPPGGPEDKTPPQVLRTYPGADSTNVGKLDYLEIEFDEDLDRASIRDQIWLLPELPGNFELKWKGGKKFRLVLQDSLEQDQTYLLTIGTGLRDLHNNNLNEPIVVPFSTGPVIDKGEISGRVMGENPRGVFIYAYQLSDSFSAKTVYKRKPRYYTQAGKTGEYHIKYLSPAVYRVYALKDEDGNRLYTLQTDWIGIPFTDAVLNAARMQYDNINFTLIREDTTAPVLVRSNALYNQRIEVIFNEPLEQFQEFNVEIMDSVKQTPLRILAAELEQEDPSNVLLFTDSQEETKYVGRFIGAKDEAGNAGGEERFVFTGVSEPDTSSPTLSGVIPEQGKTNVRYDVNIRIDFSQPVDTVSVKNGVQIIDEDSTVVAGHWQFNSLFRPEFIPDTLLGKNRKYILELNMGEIYTLFRKPFGDSLYVYQFKTWDWSELGEVGGTVFTEKKSWKKAILEAVSYRTGDIYSRSEQTNQPYLIPFMPDGLYRIKATIDVNENGTYDGGQSDPFIFSEPFLNYPDTVNVRKRWTTDGINFQFNP